jgi:hypothetical protein
VDLVPGARRDAKVTTFRDLFDGETLNGWHAVPRLPTPAYPGAEEPDVGSEHHRAGYEP